MTKSHKYYRRDSRKAISTTAGCSTARWQNKHFKCNNRLKEYISLQLYLCTSFNRKRSKHNKGYRSIESKFKNRLQNSGDIYSRVYKVTTLFKKGIEKILHWKVNIASTNLTQQVPVHTHTILQKKQHKIQSLLKMSFICTLSRGS